MAGRHWVRLWDAEVLWNAEVRDMVAQRPGNICVVKLVMSERHRAVKGCSIQPWPVLSAGKLSSYSSAKARYQNRRPWRNQGDIV